MSSTSFTCIRYSIFLLNTFFVVSGILITWLGIYIKEFYYCYEPFVEKRYLYAPDFLIALGAIIFLVSFIGCCGILTENSCVSKAMTTVLVLIFFFEMGIGLAGYIMKEEANEYLQIHLPTTMTQYNTSQEIHKAWDGIQNTFHCCGVRGSKDWTNIHMDIPESCYSQLLNNSAPVLHEVGCIENFGNFVRKHSTYIEVAGLSLSMLQLFGIICSCLLTSEYRKGYETV